METASSDIVDLLSQNIFWLTSYPLNYIQTLTSENTSLKELSGYGILLAFPNESRDFTKG